jgi:hypothetical protein
LIDVPFLWETDIAVAEARLAPLFLFSNPQFDTDLLEAIAISDQVGISMREGPYVLARVFCAERANLRFPILRTFSYIASRITAASSTVRALFLKSGKLLEC